MRVLALFLIATLAACAAPPKVVDKPVYVDRVVMVNCVTEMPEKPYLVVPYLQDEDPLDTVTDSYMIDRRLLMGYTEVLESVLIACLVRSSEGLESVPGQAIDNPSSGELH